MKSILIASAREIVQLPSWTDEGDYLVNITLQNLHSDKEFGKNKYIHNTTNTIHVQYPVLESFTDNLLEYWLTTDSECLLVFKMFIFEKRH